MLGKNTCFVIPAGGDGTRVGGRKPFISRLGVEGHELGLDKIMAMADLPTWLALPKQLGCPSLKRGCNVVFLDEPTAGQGHTVNLLLRQIDRVRSGGPYDWALISNCDNAIDPESVSNAVSCVRQLAVKDIINGIVFTFKPLQAGDTRFSYVKTGKYTFDSEIIAIAEKEAISDKAVAGVYLLRMQAFFDACRPTHLNLSDTLALIPRLVAKPVKHYEAWNDAAQLAEWRAGTVQHVVG